MRPAYQGGPGSSVGIATDNGLDGPEIESRWEVRFSALVQTDHGAHPASCTMGTAYFPRVKSGRCVTLTPHHLIVPWSWKGRAIPLLPLWTVGSVCTEPQCLYKGALYLFTCLPRRIILQFLYFLSVSDSVMRNCTGNACFCENTGKFHICEEDPTLILLKIGLIEIFVSVRWYVT